MFLTIFLQDFLYNGRALFFSLISLRTYILCLSFCYRFFFILVFYIFFFMPYWDYGLLFYHFCSDTRESNNAHSGSTPITSISDLTQLGNIIPTVQVQSRPDILSYGDISHNPLDISVSTIASYATTTGFIYPEQKHFRPLGDNTDINTSNQNNNNSPYDKLFQPPKRPVRENLPPSGDNLYLNEGEPWEQRSVHLYQRLSPEYRYKHSSCPNPHNHPKDVKI